MLSVTNVDFLIHSGKYGVINTTYPKIFGYSVVKYIFDAYILQEYTACDVKTSTSG